MISSTPIIYIEKTRAVKTPEWGTKGSAGLDFFIPEDFLPMELVPGESVKIPSGIKTRFDDGKVLIAFNKSGVSTKMRLQVGACVVDSDYDGEIHLHLYNTGCEKVVLGPGMKIAQFILLDYNMPILQLLHELPKRETERGEGGFGSTNSK